GPSARRASRASGAGGLHLRGALARAAPAVLRARDRGALALFSLGADDRSPAVPAWRRHPDRARPLRRGRRPAALSAPRGVERRLGHRALRAPLGGAAPARADHQGRLSSRSPPLGRGGQPLPPPAAGRRPPGAPPARRRSAGAGDRLARSAPPALPLAAS